MFMTVLHKIVEHDTSGMVEYSEFISMSLKQQDLITRKNLERAFMKLDLDNSGGLSVEELRRAFDAGGVIKRSKTYWENLVK